MYATPTGDSVFHDGNEVGRYGIDQQSNSRVLVWFHCGLRKYREPAWAMEQSVEAKIGDDIETILVTALDEKRVYAVSRDSFRESVEDIDGDEQLVARATDGFVHVLGRPNETLGGNLYIESGNEVNENYHQEAGH